MGMTPVDSYIKMMIRSRIGVTVRTRDIGETNLMRYGAPSPYHIPVGRKFRTCSRCTTTFDAKIKRECPFCHAKL